MLAAAAEEFARHGVEATRIDDIAAAAGVSRGTFFHYFPRKEDTLLALAAVQLGHMQEIAESGLADGERPVRDTALACLLAFVESDAPPVVLGAAVREIAANRRRFEAMLGERRPAYLDVLGSLMAEGQRRGEVRDDVAPQALAFVLSSAVLSPFLLAPAGPGTPLRSLADTVGTCFDVVWDGMGRKASRQVS